MLSKREIGIDPAWVRISQVSLAPYETRRAREVLGWKPACRTGAEVIRRYVERDPGRMDPRLALFFRMVDFGAQRAPIIHDLVHTVSDSHLWLTGPGGGDITLQIRHGRIRVFPGVPRPPVSVAIIKTSHFLDMLAGRSDFSVAQVTGRLKIEGDPTAAFLLGGMIAMFKKQRDTATGLQRRVLSAFTSWLAKEKTA